MTVITDRKEVRKIFNALIRCLKNDKNSILKVRLVKVGTAEWTNGLTLKPQKVKDVYVLGFQSSSKPLVINNISIYSSDLNFNNAKYVINNKFSHINMSEFSDTKVYNLKGDGKILPSEFQVEFTGQEFCNPITALHVLETDEKDISILLKANMGSQNYDDAYSSYESVTNGSLDFAVKCGNSGRVLLKENASPIELLLGLSGSALTNISPFDVNLKLREIISLDKHEVWAKRKDESRYRKIEKCKLRALKDIISEYYPVFDYRAIQRMNIEIPKDKFDLGVFGLGSAGTAILDQVCRSNWIKTIYLCDYDFVEAKNMINQWYDSNDIGISKVTASKSHISELKRPANNIIPTTFFVDSSNIAFQKVNLETKSFKYVVSGFDSIKSRMDFLNAILDGKIEAKYLIDCRYLDLACSIYIIDLENLEEIEFYKANLEADAELIKIRNEKETLTKDEFIDWFNRKGYFESDCLGCRNRILKTTNYCTGNIKCKSNECIDFLYEQYLASLPNPLVSRTDASCVKYNYIDIYKYVGSIVFGAFRNIENTNKKPFALVEAETDVKGLPSCMVVRR